MEIFEKAQSEIEEKDIKIEYLMQIKKRTDFELEKALFDKKQVNEELEEAKNLIKVLEKSRRGL